MKWFDFTEQNEETVHEVEETVEQKDDIITLSDVKEFLIKNKFYVWLFAIIPLGSFMPSDLIALKAVFLILQISAFAILCWIGWKGVFDRFLN